MKCHMKCRSCLWTLSMFKYTTEIFGLFEKIGNNLKDGESSINSIPVLCLPLRLVLKRVWIAYLNRDNLLLFPILLSQNERCLQHHRGLKKKKKKKREETNISARVLGTFNLSITKQKLVFPTELLFFFFLSPMVLRFSPFHPKYAFPRKCIIFLPSTKPFTRP